MIKPGESGAYLVLTAILSVVFISFFALALGLGFVYSNKARLQVLANLAGLAAVDAYMRYDGGGSEAQRRAAAVQRANEIVTQNPLPGLKKRNDGLGQLGTTNSPGSAGTIAFTRYYPEDPGVPVGCSVFPCSREAGPNEEVNAVRVQLSNSENPVVTPFANFLGRAGFEVSAASTVTMVETCGAYLLDVSLSTVNQTHRFPYQWQLNYDEHQQNLPPYIVPVADNSSLFAYQRKWIGMGTQSPYPPASLYPECNQPFGPGTSYPNTPVSDPEYPLWCNMEAQRNYGVPYDKLVHYKSDYRQVTAWFGSLPGGGLQSFDLMVDRVTKPEPLRHFFHGFNAGLRLVNTNKSVADRAMFRAFTGEVFNRKYPLESSQPLTSNLDPLIHLTNMDNAGQLDEFGTLHNERAPHYLTQGWFPLITGDEATSGTNQVKILFNTIQELNQHCPASSKKFIVLATDGVPTCRYRWDGISLPPPDGHPDEICIGGPDGWPLYRESEARLLTDVLDMLIESKIALTVILDGETSHPHFRNVPHPDATTKKEEYEACEVDSTNSLNCFLDFTQAQELGKNGVAAPPANFLDGWNTDHDGINYLMSCMNAHDTIFYSCVHEVDGATAWGQPAFIARSEFRPNVKFRRPQAVFGHMSLKSGGRFCPLLETGPVSDYYGENEAGDPRSCSLDDFGDGQEPCLLRNDRRGFYAIETRAIEYLRKGEQAAKCVRDAIGTNRYLHVDPKQEVLTAPPSGPGRPVDPSPVDPSPKPPVEVADDDRYDDISDKDRG